MKRWIALALMLVIILPALAHADAPIERDMDALTIGVVTPLSGDFFTDMWGTNTSDMDVRELIHGYSTVAYTRDGHFELDNTVVLGAEVTDDERGRTYKFTLNGALKYADGTPITAKDYVFSALLLSDPRMTQLGSVSSWAEHLAGYEAYAGGGGAFSGVRLISDGEFSLTIKRERLPDFYELTLVAVKPYPMHVIAPGCAVRDDGAGAYLDGELTADLLRQTVLDPQTGYRYHPSVTSGPYILTQYDRDAHIAEFIANPEYLGNYEGTSPRISRLTIVPAIQDSMIADLQSGELDLIHKISSGERISQAQALAMSGEIASQNYLRAGLSFLSFACEQGPTQSQPVRQAIALCTDPQGLVDGFLQGYGLVSYAYYGYGQWMTEVGDDQLLSLARYSLNVNAAIGLLEDDGWALNEDGSEYDDELGGVRHRMAQDGSMEKLSIRWAYPANTDAIATLRPMLEANMAQAGFELLPTELPFDALLRNYYRQDERGYDMFFLGANFALTFDPYPTFAVGEPYQGIHNATGIRDDQLMQLAADLRSTPPEDTEGYLAKWLAFQQRFVEVLPLAPLYGNIYFDFYRPDLRDYRPSAHWTIGSALLYAHLGEADEEEIEEDPSSPNDSEEIEIVD